MPDLTPVRTEDLLDTFGVATHINFTDGVYAPIEKVLQSLDYLGIDHVRDRAPNPNYARVGQLHLEDAAKAGIKFVVHGLAKEDPFTIVRNIHAFEEKHPGAIAGIEGPNEVDHSPVTYKGMTGTPAALAYQKDLFDAVNADPLLRHIPVLSFTDDPVRAAASDWTNIHPYPRGGNQPWSSISRNVERLDAADPGKSFAITEIGYHTSLGADTGGGWEGVDASTQAKLLLNAYMDAAELGSRGTYLYQLLDSPADGSGADQENHFGLFDAQYRPKPAAKAIHNLTTILGDEGANATSFATGNIVYATAGLPESGHTFLTQKADGSFQIILWAEPDIWDEAADKPIPVAGQRVDLTFDRMAASIQVFDPLLGTSATKSLQSTSTVSVSLSDHPVIVEVRGFGVPTAGWGDTLYTITQVGTTVLELPGAGSDTISTTLARYVLPANVETLVFTGTGAFAGSGNALDNAITGGSGADVLDGKAGADRLTGGTGNDTYYVDNAGDLVIEAAGGGSDKVYSRLDHKLGAHVEKLILNTGSAIVAEGNELANSIVGNANANRIDGGAGADILTGKGGDDIFVFRTALASAQIDVITDFSNAVGNNDRIELENAVFTALKTTGLLTAGAFAANLTGLATQADDRIIYETDTGRLYYDANGSAAGGGQVFADLAANLRLTNADFFIV